MQREFIFTDRWLDLVFENRNQSYGAYVLRKHLPRNILIGYMAALVFMGAVIFTGYQFSKISIGDINAIVDLPTSILYEIKSAAPDVAPEKKPEPKSPPSKSSGENLIAVIKDSINDSETKEKIVTSENTSASKDTSGIGTNDSNKSSAGSELKLSGESKDPLFPYNVEKIPEFPGGDLALMKFMLNNTHYPYQYLDESISGTVYISFVVDSTGKVYRIKSEKDVENYSGFTDEAIKAISKMPRWIPGRQNGRNVSVVMTLPVKFSVKKDF